ncbi:MAG: hypothetical protein JWP74_1310 [Marmoricola sp.]|nr:hypothetical protein [Marmoricola sp.]
MTALPPSFLVTGQPEQAQLEAFLDEHRDSLGSCLDGLTEQEARRVLVASGTTLLGLVKHAVYVEKIWFDEAVSGRSRAEIGIPDAAPDSYLLVGSDTIADLLAAHRAACEASRRTAADLDLDTVLTGNRHGDFPLRWVYWHMLRELAEHCGHADILREQVLSART